MVRSACSRGGAVEDTRARQRVSVCYVLVLRSQARLPIKEHHADGPLVVQLRICVRASGEHRGIWTGCFGMGQCAYVPVSCVKCTRVQHMLQKSFSAQRVRGGHN